MIKWNETIGKALEKISNRESYVYFYGAKGEFLDTATMKRLWDAEPVFYSKFSPKEKEEIFLNSFGKIGYDCSGFVGTCIGDMTYSAAQASHCTPNESPKQGPAGSLLYTTFGGAGRHIAIDLGYGYFINMSNMSTDEVVKAGRDSIWIGKISEFPWEFSGKHQNIDYDGATNK